MTNREIQNKVKQFKKEYGIVRCDYARLRTAAEQQGYTLIEYNHIFNDEAVQTVIDSLNLTDSILRSKGFTYADKDYRLLFVHEDLSEQEKTVVLAHENGHIFLNHLSSRPIIGKDVQEEYEANEFSHYLLNNTTKMKAADFLRKHKKTVICCILAIVIAIVSIVAINIISTEKKYYGEYYITTSGNKYHEEGCIFVKDKNNVQRLTKEQFESGEYEPCQMCLP